MPRPAVASLSSILLEMHMHWVSHEGYKVEILDKSPTFVPNVRHLCDTTLLSDPDAASVRSVKSVPPIMECCSSLLVLSSDLARVGFHELSKKCHLLVS